MPLITLYFFIKAAIEKSNLAYRAGAHHQGDGLLAQVDSFSISTRLD